MLLWLMRRTKECEQLEISILYSVSAAGARLSLLLLRSLYQCTELEALSISARLFCLTL